MAKDTFLNLEQTKKQKIIEAAILEFSRTIPDHINIQNIIRDAQIPRGSFYQYFDNKEDLYLFILIYIGEQKQNFFLNHILNTDQPFLSYLKDLYALSYQFMIENPMYYKAGKNMMSFKYFEQFEMLKNSKDQANQYYEALIKRDQENGLIDPSIDPKLLSSLTIDFMDMNKLDTYYEAGMSIEDFNRRIDKIMMILKKGIENYV